MGDERSSEGVAPSPAGQPGTADPPAARADQNSRIETRLWLLYKDKDRAEARMCAKFGRRDFRVYVNGELLWSRNYAFDETARFDADAAAKHAELTALGWGLPPEVPSE
ncbi:MAG: hypothetical protein ABI880_11585 [Acidobacteriota bacterium]